VAYFEKEGRELVGLNYAEPLASPLWGGCGEALGHAGYFAELIDEWAPEGDPNEKLFRLGASVVGALAADVPIEPLARYFEYWILRLQGVYPSLLACQSCGALLDGIDGAWLLPGERGFTCQDCSPGRLGGRASRVSREALGFLRAASTVGPDRVGELGCSRLGLRELEVAHRALIVVHLEKELKSARVLREVRGAGGPG
jgi:DNA repair protein RecO (recombination protein O)